MSTAAHLLVQALEAEGVAYIFGVPGEENLDVLEAIRTSSIKFVVTRHEQAAGFMAATVGRLTGKPGVCLSTLGPGATNFVTAAAYAQLGGMPMLMITGQKPVKQSKQGHFQIVNTVDIMRPVTKFTKQIISARSIPSLVREVFRVAEDERPGAVHLELPEDIASEEIDMPLLTTTPTRRPAAEEKAVKGAVELIERAKRPLILVGAGANRKLVSKSLLRFIDKTRIPFFNTQMGKGVIDERHPLYIGTAALSDNDYLHCAIERADLIINVGHDVIEKPPFIMKPGGQSVIHINFLGAKVDEVYFPQWEVVGDIGNALWQMTEKMTPQAHWDLAYFLKVKQHLETHIARDGNTDRFPLVPQRIVTDVRRVMPDDGILCLDNGMYKIWFARNYKAYEPNTVLLDNALATMGAGVPSAIAAKMIYPEKKVVALCGDGGFMMNSQELETAVRLKLDLTIVIVNDNGYGMIQWKQQASGFPPFGLSFSNPDFIAYAKSYGIMGQRVERVDDFGEMLQAGIRKPGVHIIEVPIDYSENERVLTQELKAKTCLVE